MIKEENMNDYGRTSHSIVFSIIIRISDIESRASTMIETISNTSWLNTLAPVEKITFSARSERTIRKLVDLIKDRATDEVTTEFGEFMVSDAAKSALQKHLKHKEIPIAELLKEKISGNPGFDFHTESDNSHIAFGEAKYSGNINPHPAAINQIVDFITLKKDDAELSIIQNFVSKNAIDKYVNGKKAYIAAFSINSDTPESIIINALKSDGMEKLLAYPEVFVIGVKVNA